ncbi:hypothetical protein OV450_1141 [Actinobacteria bacterium OV450]|nr:hypothetical protein OV450_1141 [Actinobacteria bacterium OV450]
MRPIRMPVRLPGRAGAATVGLGVIAGLALLTAPTASGHGYTDTPISR